MRRGEVWTVSSGPDYVGKTRPAVVIQSDAFSDTASVTVCPITSDETEAPLLRPVLQPDADNGLRQASRVMIDKVSTLSRAKLGKRIGALSDQQMQHISRLVVNFLALA